MIDTEDLVTQLRRVSVLPWDEIESACTKTADALTALQAENAELRDGLRKLGQVSLRAEEVREHAERKCAELRQELEEARREMSLLLDALKDAATRLWAVGHNSAAERADAAIAKATKETAR
jgi:FtsZ-binding cell division protein ZapB